MKRETVCTLAKRLQNLDYSKLSKREAVKYISKQCDKLYDDNSINNKIQEQY